MVTMHIFGDDHGNLAATQFSEPIHGHTRFIATQKVDEGMWGNICSNPELAQQGRLNEFLRNLIPESIEKILSV